MFKKINYSFYLLLFIYGIEGIAANLAHPVTPTLIKQLSLPNYIFGLAFAIMQVANFLMSPFWGSLIERIQPKIVLFIGCLGYAFGQYIFLIAQDQTVLLIGRFVSGFFVSATLITAVYYLIKITDLSLRKLRLPILITSFTVMGTFGQFIGGILGNHDYRKPFYLQIALLIFCALMFLFCLKNVELIQDHTSMLSKINPFHSFKQMYHHLNKVFILQFTAVFLLTFASTSISQTFGFYLVDALGVSSAVNGISRGIVGFLAILINSTITIEMIKSKNVEKKIAYLLCVILGILVLLSQNYTMYHFFIVSVILIMTMDTMLASLIQERTSFYSKEDIQGITTGMHNAMKALGSIIGATVAGYLYNVRVIYPFMITIGLYFMAFVIYVLLGKDVQVSK